MGILWGILGSEGQRIFRTLGPVTSYADCVALLGGHFAAPQSVIVRRIIFHQCRQRPAQLAQTVGPATRPSSPAFAHDELEVNVAEQHGATARRPCGN
ncbi:hypothetical protein L3Q82_000709 [Scortum barcoo]|uniref:Uncharacterized protein n=1 Tax=Scortum barcoo TaxID=214431 RepID=A0ACB8WCK9_9TELE|nr:hypothetical protein L3Q82_000709 [Scortum barcoo]